MSFLRQVVPLVAGTNQDPPLQEDQWGRRERIDSLLIHRVGGLIWSNPFRAHWTASLVRCSKSRRYLTFPGYPNIWMKRSSCAQSMETRMFSASRERS